MRFRVWRAKKKQNDVLRNRNTPFQVQEVLDALKEQQKPGEPVYFRRLIAAINQQRQPPIQKVDLDQRYQIQTNKRLPKVWKRKLKLEEKFKLQE